MLREGFVRGFEKCAGCFFFFSSDVLFFSTASTPAWKNKRNKERVGIAPQRTLDPHSSLLKGRMIQVLGGASGWMTERVNEPYSCYRNDDGGYDGWPIICQVIDPASNFQHPPDTLPPPLATPTRGAVFSIGIAGTSVAPVPPLPWGLDRQARRRRHP